MRWGWEVHTRLPQLSISTSPSEAIVGHLQAPSVIIIISLFPLVKSVLFRQPVIINLLQSASQSLLHTVPSIFTISIYCLSIVDLFLCQILVIPFLTCSLVITGRLIWDCIQVILDKHCILFIWTFISYFRFSHSRGGISISPSSGTALIIWTSTRMRRSPKSPKGPFSWTPVWAWFRYALKYSSHLWWIPRQWFLTYWPVRIYWVFPGPLMEMKASLARN